MKKSIIAKCLAFVPLYFLGSNLFAETSSCRVYYVGKAMYVPTGWAAPFTAIDTAYLVEEVKDATSSEDCLRIVKNQHLGILGQKNVKVPETHLRTVNNIKITYEDKSEKLKL